MRLRSIVTTLLTCAATIVVAVPAATPSGAPTCSYACPAIDDIDFHLGQVSTPAPGTLRCDYPYPNPSGTPGVYYCDYNTTTGGVKLDEDGGFCPPSAVQTCASSRRRNKADPYVAYKRRLVERAAAPAPMPASVPQFMNTRAVLGKRKLIDRRA